jgi:hypothetical protein
MASALDLLSSLRLENGRRWGEAAEPFQWADARAVLDTTADAPLQHFLTRPRGASKTSDLGGIAIAALLTQLAARSSSYAVAADRDQGRLLLDAIGGFVARTEELGRALDVRAWSVVNPRTGATLEVLAADGPSAYGLRPHLLIADELAQWPSTPNARAVWEAVVSALPKVPGARLVVLTSAGSPAHWAHTVREHAREHARWRLHEVPGPTPWIDPEALAEQRALLTESQYARLHLNQWVTADDSLVHPEDLAACVVLPGPQDYAPGNRYVVALDVGLKKDRTVAAVCHAYAGMAGQQRVALDRVAVWQGSRKKPVALAEVEAWVAEASRLYGDAEVVLDPWQAVGLAQRLRGEGHRVTEFSFTAQSVGRLASTLHLLLRDRALDLPDDAELLDELANVRLRETSPGVVRLEHDAGKHDDRAVSLALAAQHLLGERVVSEVVRSSYYISSRDRRGVVREPPQAAEISEAMARHEEYVRVHPARRRRTYAR